VEKTAERTMKVKLHKTSILDQVAVVDEANDVEFDLIFYEILLRRVCDVNFFICMDTSE